MRCHEKSYELIRKNVQNQICPIIAFHTIIFVFILGGLLLYFTLSVLVCCATFAATFAQSLLENLRNIEVTMPQLPQMPQLSVEDDPDVAKYEFKADYYGVNLVLYVGFTIFFIFAVSIFK